MRSNALRKPQLVLHHNDNHPETAEAKRARIARAAEAASHGPDLSEFAEAYGIEAFA